MLSYIERFKKTIGTALSSALGGKEPAGSKKPDTGPARVLFIANGVIPTLQLSFFKPLASIVDQGGLVTGLLSEQEMAEKFGKQWADPEVTDWVDKKVAEFNPTIMVFCRYSGPHTAHLTKFARKAGIATVFHIDDDLLNVPVEIGQKKYEAHNRPTRLEAVRTLLENVDIVYCSTQALKQRFEAAGFRSHFKVGAIYCSGKVLTPAVHRPVKKIGYMGFDHAHDLEMVLPAVVQVLRRNPEVEFELFGSIPKPAVLEEFGARVSVVPPIPNYEEFLHKFSSLNWDIGICPLVKSDFNAVKANTKWVEYTSVGTAVVASAGTIYDTCCADGCGLLAGTTEEWVSAIEALVHDSQKRYDQLTKAQKRLSEDYSTERLRLQVMDVLDAAQQMQKS
jgi:glycosyltransferase involved in cell wall biosynthesis